MPKECQIMRQPAGSELRVSYGVDGTYHGELGIQVGIDSKLVRFRAATRSARTTHADVCIIISFAPHDRRLHDLLRQEVRSGVDLEEMRVVRRRHGADQRLEFRLVRFGLRGGRRGRGRRGRC